MKNYKNPPGKYGSNSCSFSGGRSLDINWLAQVPYIRLSAVSLPASSSTEADNGVWFSSSRSKLLPEIWIALSYMRVLLIKAADTPMVLWDDFVFANCKPQERQVVMTMDGRFGAETDSVRLKLELDWMRIILTQWVQSTKILNSAAVLSSVS